MRWLYDWTTAETLWVLAFLLIYGWYGARIVRASKVLRQGPRLWWMKLLLRAVVVGLALVALLGPLLEGGREKVMIENKDIFFCVDVSSSMDAQDVLPSRISKVKFELKHMIQALEGSRMGLIIFSSEAFIQSPLTYDVSALMLFVDALKTDLVARGGTNFGAALCLAHQRLEDAAEDRQGTPAAQVVVLISDGEDFGTYTKDAIESLKSRDLSVFTLGIGTEEGTFIPTSRGPRRDRRGAVIHTSLKRDLLEDIGIDYFEINATLSQITPLIARLREVKGSVELQTDTRLGAMNIYSYFLVFALVLCILDVFLPVRVFRL